jgi:hypothetical protein
MNRERFRPVAYSLSERGIEFPLQQTKTSANESREDQISIWDLLKELEGQNYQIDDQLTQLVVATESETRALKAATCILTLTNLILEAWQEGIKPLGLTWFWLETRMFDAGISHTFFVVDRAGNRIVREEMHLIEGPETSSRFDRAVFEPDNESRSSGLAAYWYGRFYQETKLGKLCMLASGWRRPKIFYQPHGLGSDLRTIRFLLIAILGCLIVLLVRR